MDKYYAIKPKDTLTSNNVKSHDLKNCVFLKYDRISWGENDIIAYSSLCPEKFQF